MASQNILLEEISLASSAPVSHIQGCGVDPAFVSSSNVYQPGLEPSSFYNISLGSGQVNINGNPWGFFSIDLPGELSLC